MLRTRTAPTTALVALVALLAGAVPAAATQPAPAAPPPLQLDWEPCGGQAAAVRCAAAQLPLDHDEPDGEQVSIAVAKSPATDPEHRLGSLFLNFGGPGAPAVEVLAEVGPDLFPALNERFDVIAFDPRGVGLSEPAVDCQVPAGAEEAPVPDGAGALVAEAEAYAGRCLALNGELLEHVSTANVARDLDALRAAVGDERLTYLGFSYGSLLGATYSSLFPGRARALVLDGAVDSGVLLDPLAAGLEQTAGFDDAFERFAAACAADQVACSGFGGADPLRAFDELVARAGAVPVPAPGYADDPRPVTGQELLDLTAYALYSKRAWGDLGLVLALADAGDASLARQVLDEELHPTDPDGTVDPSVADQYVAVAGVDGDWPSEVGPYLDAAQEEGELGTRFPGTGGLLVLGLWPAEDDDAFRGPLSFEGEQTEALVVGTTHDPATPYRWAERLTDELGRARLLTMDGDGHTAYLNGSACVDAAVEAYLVDLVVPEPGTTCAQDLPFTAPAPEDAGPAEAPEAPAAP